VPSRPVRPRATAARKGGTRPPISRDRELEELARSCARRLEGGGPRTAQGLLATIPEDTEVDYYGMGGAVAALEAEVARLLGKESALFLPTGTMAQQAVLRVHADRRGGVNVAFHPTCHLDGWAEERGYQGLHGLFGVPVGPREEPLSLAALEAVRQPVDALLLELPQRALGGTLPTWSELQAQARWARAKGAALHLDGARLWEAAPYYASQHRKSIIDVADTFDSIYVSFYKGLGGLGGCCVAADADVIEELSVWRTRHGGRVFMMWPYAASALTVLRDRLPRFPTYFRHARAIAKALRGLEGVEVLPDPPQSAMLHLRVRATPEELRTRAVQIAKAEGVWTFARPFASEGPGLQRFELSVGDATLELSPGEIRSIMERLVPRGRSSASR
jgi:threonine aldolase